MKISFNIQDVYKVINSPSLLNNKYVLRDGFAFTSLKNHNIFDALIIRETLSASCVYEAYSVGSRTIDECIELINSYSLENVIIIANDLSVLKQCPSIKHFVFYLNSKNHKMPKMSDLSLMPGIRQFRVGGYDGVDELYTGGTSPFAFQKLKTLKRLNMQGTDEKSSDKQTSIKTIEDFDLPELLKLDMVKCNIKSLSGIENCPKLQWLSLSNMRSLTDISALLFLAPTLRALYIEGCPKLFDFTVVSALRNLEYLELTGKNELPNLDFIKELPKLKFLKLSMTVLDGDVSCLQSIQYVDAVCKKHYNLRSRDLPKDTTNLGFQFI